MARYVFITGGVVSSLGKLERLIEDLDKIGTLPADPGENPDNEDPFFDERARIIATVAAVAQFMQELPELDREERLRPLVTLLKALIDVHEGKKSELLLSDGPPGGPLTLGELFSRARYAAAMTIFHKRAGHKKEPAARLVSRLVSDRDAHLFKNKTPPYKQIIRWRREFMEEVHPDGARHYRDF